DAAWPGAIAGAAAPRRPGAAQPPAVFFLKLNPSRLRKRQTVSCETMTPRSLSKSLRRCSVRCGTSSTWRQTKSRCASSRHLRWPPNLAGATLPVSRSRFDHLMTVDGARPNRAAMERLLSPDLIAFATRERRSSEEGFAMHAGPLSPACMLNQKATVLEILSILSSSELL